MRVNRLVFELENLTIDQTMPVVVDLGRYGKRSNHRIEVAEVLRSDRFIILSLWVPPAK